MASRRERAGRQGTLARRGGRPAAAPIGIEPLESRTLLASYTVTSPSGDRGVQGSLPWAVFQSNYATKGPDVIRFSLPAAARTIRLAETLYLNDRIVIDGLSQPGSSAASPGVTIRGSAAVSSLFILQGDPSQGTTSTGSTIQGLVMAEYAANGITIFPASTGNTIQNNWIGFSLEAGNVVRKTASAGTYQAAIGIQSSNNMIRANTIAGVYNGINMGEDVLRSWSGAVYAGNTITGNRIGTNPQGTSAVGYGNRSDGIFFGAGAQRNVIGPGNVLSGNASSGIEFLHPSVVGNVVQGNKIGTDAAGQVAIGNGELGILVANGASGNTIGTAAGPNLISGNRLGGVVLGTAAFPGARANVVQNNVIGLNAARTAGLGVQTVGISVESNATANVITANEIGGHVQHGMILAQTTSNTINRNFLGRSAAGKLVANKGFGIVFLAAANSNTGSGNVFGSNTLGRIYTSPQARSNRVT